MATIMIAFYYKIYTTLSCEIMSIQYKLPIFASEETRGKIAEFMEYIKQDINASDSTTIDCEYRPTLQYNGDMKTVYTITILRKNRL